MRIETGAGIVHQALRAGFQDTGNETFAHQGGRTAFAKVRGALSSNDGDIVLGWALDGQGIVIRSDWDLAKYLESGRLRRLLPDFVIPNADLYVYYPSKQNLAARSRAFIDFLVAQLATNSE